MTILEISLLIALLASLGVGVWLWISLRQTRLQVHAHRNSEGHQSTLYPTNDTPHHSYPSSGVSYTNSPDVLPPLFRAVASALDAGLILISSERRVYFLNAQAEDLLGVSAYIARGRGLFALMRDHQVDMLVREVLRDGEPRETTIKISSTERTLRLHCTPLKVHQEVSASNSSTRGSGGILMLIRDMTQISLLERARRDLVANVSHELRTPLASLKLLVETVQSDPPPDVAKRMLEQITHEIDAITQLVNELHELSQLESGRVMLKLSCGSLETVIEHTIDRIRPQADVKKLQVQFCGLENAPQVLMDEQRIGQVLLNLVHNAVEFTPEGGRILVKMCVILVDEKAPLTASIEQDSSYTDIAVTINQNTHYFSGTRLAHMLEQTSIRLLSPHPPGSWMLVSVTDTGIGIPARDVTRIFERFYKVDRSRTRTTGGSGLGLAIAKHLIEGHGGRVWVESQEGQGSTFYFTLPVA